MTTNDIIESLGMVSLVTMPQRLINEIHAALAERDELRTIRAAVVWESQRVDALHLAQAQDEKTIASLRAELESEKAEFSDFRVEQMRVFDDIQTQHQYESGVQGRIIKELRAKQSEAIAHIRAIVDATIGYAETADAIIEAERWLRKMDAKGE